MQPNLGKESRDQKHRGRRRKSPGPDDVSLGSDMAGGLQRFATSAMCSPARTTSVKAKRG